MCCISFAISLEECCGQLLAVAITEWAEQEFRGKKPSVLLIGSREMAESLDKLGMPAGCITDPFELDSREAYDLIVVFEQARELESVRLLKSSGKLMYVKEGKMHALSADQAAEIEGIAGSAGLRIREREPTPIPVEFHSMLTRIHNALKKNGVCLMLDLLDPANAKAIAKSVGLDFSSQEMPRFLMRLAIGKMRVINSNILLAHSPHPANNSNVLKMLEKYGPKGSVIPYPALKKGLSATEEEILEPYVYHFHSVFDDWSDYVKDMYLAAKHIEKDLENEKLLKQLYSTVSVLEESHNGDFREKAYQKAQEILEIPPKPNIFAVELRKRI